jgi:hypothetical protein
MQRLVPEAEFHAAIHRLEAVEDATLGNRGGIGVTARWLTPQGKLCAYLFVRYFKGEEDCDYWLADPPESVDV